MKKKSLFIILLIALLFLLPFALTGCSPLDKRYTVTFDTDGGTVIESQKVDYGQKAIKPEQIPTKDGYEFDGWYYGEDEWIFLGYVITENTTLKAKWKPIEYQITYNAGSAATMPTYGVTTKYTIESDNITLPVPTIEWYEFLGWYDNSQREGEPIFELTTGHFGNLNLYAKYQYVGLKFTKSSGSYQVSSADPRLGDEGWVLPNASQGELIIPDTYKGEKVTSINSSTFKNNTKIKSLTIGKNITSIGSDAFLGCTSLTSVNYTGTIDSWLEKGLASSFVTGYNLYINGDIVEEANITTATKIPNSAFYNCTSLTSVTIGNSVTSIGNYAFYKCTSLTNIEIPGSVTSIGWYAFSYCESLTSVNYTGTIDSWAQISFDSSTSNPLTYAKNLYINNELVTNANITTATKINRYAFNDCTSLTSVTIGNSVTSIGDWAFEFCYSLTSVTIGDSVTSIGEYAFSGCFKLIEVVNKSPYITIEKGNSSSNGYVGKYALAVYNSGDDFSGTKLSNDNGYIVYTEGNEKILVGYNGTETELVLPNYITKIKDYAFYKCTSLTSVTIGDSVTSIGYYAFSYCDSLTSVMIGDSVTSIGEDVFYNCTSLTSVTIGDSVTSIGSYAFRDCDSLTSITIPDSVTSIGYYAFENCTSLVSVIIGDSVTSIGGYAFYNCTSLASVIIGDSVTSIGYYAFYNCTSLTSINFNGTKAQWNAISKGSYWKNNVKATYVTCSDGTATI